MNVEASPSSVVITGAANGIGLATARLLSKSMRVFAIDCSSDLHENLSDVHGCELIIGDISQQSFWKDLSAQLTGDLKPGLDGLVNAAGVMRDSDGGIGTLESTSWSDTLAINALGPMLSAKFLLPLLRMNGGGAIVNVGSVVSRIGSTRPQLAYTASKGALISASRELAVCEAANGVRVNVVSPGLVRTRLTEHLLLDECVQRIPMSRWAYPDEIASVIQFLISQGASYITGSDVIVDGGLSAQNAFTVGI